MIKKDYSKKYLKYKEKYLKYKEKYKLEGGNSIKIKTNLNKVIDKNNSDGTNNKPLIINNNIPQNPNQTFLMKEYNDKIFFADENKNCISDNGKQENGSTMIMKKCDIADINQQFSINTKIEDNKYVFENKNKNKCLDHTYNKKLKYWDCDNKHPNQQFTIVDSEKKIDDINLNVNIDLEAREITHDDINTNYKNPTHKSFINDLNETSLNILYRKHFDIKYANIIIVNFGGKYAQFDQLYLTALSPCNIMVIRDKNNTWYHNQLHAIIDYINRFINTYNIEKVILIGQSMGGYAALYCSNFINNCVCIAFNPQTFNRLKNHPYYIYNEAIKNITFINNDLFDLRKVITDNPNDSKKYILTGKWDCNLTVPNHCDHYYHDLVFSSYLMGLPNVVLVFVPIINHNIFMYMDFISFFELITINYNILNSNIDLGKNILNNYKFKKIHTE